MVNLTLEDMGVLYRETRLRIGELVLANEDKSQSFVPATPDWTIKDVIGHLTGVCEDILSGNLADAPSDPWTAAQVERVRDVPLRELVERWSEAAPQVEPLTPMFPDRSANQWVADIVSHEHDLRGALETPGARDSDAAEVAVDFLATAFLDAAVRDKKAPPLEIVAGDDTWSTRESAPASRLVAPKFDLMRALSGRRSLNQIRAFEWDGDAEQYLESFEWGPFSPRSEDLIE